MGVIRRRAEQRRRLEKAVEDYEMWFVLAREFGQDPWQMQRTWTTRQFILACTWYHLQFNEPTRTDYYLMQLTAAVHAKSSKSVKLNSYKIKFRDGQSLATKGLTKEQVTAISKSMWLSRMTMPVVKRTKESTE